MSNMKDMFARIEESAESSWWHSRFNILPVVTVILIVLIIGFSSGAFSGDVKGWDSYNLLTRAKWLQNDISSVWNTQWHCGFFPFRRYPFLPALEVSVLSTISGTSISTSANMVTILTYLAIALSIYAIVYEITRSKVAGLLASFVCMASPSAWSHLVQYGMLSRLFAAPFGLMTIWIAIKFVKQKNADAVSRWVYLALVAFTTLSVLAHPLVTILTFSTVFLLLIFGIEGWGKKITATLTIFLLSIGLLAFYILPYLYSPTGEVVSKQISFGTAATPPASLWVLIGTEIGARPWSTMPLSFVLVPSVIILIIALVFKAKRISWGGTRATAWEGAETPPLLFRSIATFAIVSFFILYYCLQGYLPPIVSFAAVSAVHMLYFLTIFLSLLLGTLLGAFKSFCRKITFWAISVVLLIILIPSSVASSSVVNDHILRDIGKPSDAGMSALENVVNATGDGYRVVLPYPSTAYFNYKFDTPQMLGYGEPVSSLMSDFPYWQSSAVFDKGDDEETRFLLDWAAVKTVFLSDLVSKAAVSKFSGGPYVPCAYSASSSPIGYAYPDATPKVTGTDVPAVLVVGKSYGILLHAFSYADYNSKLLIPIKGHESVLKYTQSELAQFDTIILYDWYSRGEDIAKITELLVNYVGRGGNLLIFNSTHQELPYPLPEFYPMDEIFVKNFSGSWNFSAPSGTVLSNVDFSRFSPPEWGGGPWSAEAASNVRPWASVWLWAQDVPVIVGGQLGKGNVLWIGMNYIYHIIYYHNNYEAHVLSEIISYFAGSDNAHWESLTEDRPTSTHVEISVNNQVKGVLFKESYYPGWHAHVTDSVNKTFDLHVYPAGPNAMYVFLPENITYPVKVTFELSDTIYPVSSALSLISLVGLAYTLSPRIQRVFQKLRGYR